MRFRDRRDAGRQLAARLAAERLSRPASTTVVGAAPSAGLVPPGDAAG